MASSPLFQAAQAGDAAAIRALLDGDAERQSIDIHARDENGQSALLLACKSGSEEAVRELLARGADRHEALAAGFGQNASAVAAVLNEQQQQPMFASIPTDIYGGYQLPDGSIAYGGYPAYTPFQGGAAPGQPTFYHDPVMFPHPGAQAPYAPFPPMRPRGPSGSFAPLGVTSPNGQPSSLAHGSPNGLTHARKPSAVGKYPPPEVAKTIPCRFYPNCRNGASCIFAHVDSPAGGMMHPETQQSQHEGEAQNSMPPPPPGYYGMPGPYPPPFFMMPPGAVGPGAMHYGAPPAPMPLHYQPHESSHDASQPGHIMVGAHQEPPVEAEHTAQESEVVLPPAAESEAAKAGSEEAGNSEQTADAAPEAAQEDAAVTSATGAKNGDAKDAEGSADAQDRRRRQSFNSFLHTHAVPFQPSQMAPGINGSAAVAIPMGPAAMPGHGYGQTYSGRGKLRGRGGLAGMMAGGRGKHERGPCTFFARNACRYGSECLFAHVLPDGTDARRLGASSGAGSSSGSRQSGPDGQGAADGAKDPSKFNNVPRQPASMQLGPKAKRDAGLPPTPSADVTAPAAAQAANNGSLAQGKDAGKKDAKPVANGVVPSKPSATAAAAAAAAGNSPEVQPAETANGQSSTGPSQQQPTQPTQHAGPPARRGQGARGNANAQPATSKKVAAQQRVPSGADFPALPGSPNVSNGTESTATVAAPAADGPAPSTASPAAITAPKVNFSAILSAPAPAKKAAEAPAAAATAPQSESTTKDEGAPASSEQHDGKDAASATQVPQANGVASPSVNGSHTPADKAAAPPSAAAAATKSKGVNGAAAATKASPSPAARAWVNGKQNGSAVAAATTNEPNADSDDFQVVKGRNHSKRASGLHQANGSTGRAGGFANAAKAAVTA
ncbi:unnamed protein product [Parajaminaea phylloscopi]